MPEAAARRSSFRQCDGAILAAFEVIALPSPTHITSAAMSEKGSYTCLKGKSGQELALKHGAPQIKSRPSARRTF